MRNVRCQFRQQQQKEDEEEDKEQKEEEDAGLDEMRRLAKLISLIASIKLIKLTPNGSSTRRGRDRRGERGGERDGGERIKALDDVSVIVEMRLSVLIDKLALRTKCE